MQVEGIFDIPPSQHSQETWTINLDLPNDWNIGVIVGPSGSGKTTIAREMFKKNLVTTWDWPNDKSVLDGFPSDLSIKEITKVLSSVGFSSPPSWVRPFRVLSNGEQFRVNLARTLLELNDLAVVDEFTSVVDRTVAKIGSCAVAKTVRQRKQKFIAVTCHYDVLDWLEPDWVYQPATNEFYNGRYLHQRPYIKLDIKRVHYSAWLMFRKHHYLDTKLNSAATCFCAFWNDIPVAFSAWLHFLHAKKKAKREHRTVCLPDYQGVGIGNALSDFVASIIKGLGFDAISTTSSPAMVKARSKSPNWRTTRAAVRTSNGGKGSSNVNFRSARSFKRLSSSFEYIGPELPTDDAKKLWNASTPTPTPSRAG